MSEPAKTDPPPAPDPALWRAACEAAEASCRSERDAGYRGSLPAEELAAHLRAAADEVERLRDEADEKRVRLHVADLVRRCEELQKENEDLKANLELAGESK